MIEIEGQTHYGFIKYFSTLMYNQTLHRDRIYLCRYYLQSFSAAQILGRHVNDCFETNNKQMMKFAKKGETVKFKNYTGNL